MTLVTDIPAQDSDRAPQTHRTVERVTRIIEEVVYNPGIRYIELARALDAPKSSVHGFIRGLLAAGWLYEEDHRFYLGPAVYGLTLATGHIRAGLVTDSDVAALHDATGVTAFLGVKAGDHLIYVSQAGSDTLGGFGARTNIRRALLDTAGGKAILASLPEAERNSYLRRRTPDEAHLVEQFLAEYDDIRKTRLAKNTLRGGARYAIATTVKNQAGHVVAEATLVGPSTEMMPRADDLGRILLHHVDSWAKRSAAPREAF